MSKEQQIEEMARDITDVWYNKCQFVACNGCKYNDLNDNRCQEKLIADHLVSKGYRKQSEGEWLFKPTVSRTPSAINYTCSLCGFESARTTPFCPECGAKMKGESNEQGAD